MSFALMKLIFVFRVYANGFNMDISTVYPKVEFPVSRGTQMISPHIKWDHSEDWFVVSFDSQDMGRSAERKVKISLSDPGFDFVVGHFIDGEF